MLTKVLQSIHVPLYAKWDKTAKSSMLYEDVREEQKDVVVHSNSTNNFAVYS